MAGDIVQHVVWPGDPTILHLFKEHGLWWFGHAKRGVTYVAGPYDSWAECDAAVKRWRGLRHG